MLIKERNGTSATRSRKGRRPTNRLRGARPLLPKGKKARVLLCSRHRLTRVQLCIPHKRGRVFFPLDVTQRHLRLELHRPAAVALANGFSLQGSFGHSRATLTDTTGEVLCCPSMQFALDPINPGTSDSTQLYWPTSIADPSSVYGHARTTSPESTRQRGHMHAGSRAPQSNTGPCDIHCGPPAASAAPATLL